MTLLGAVVQAFGVIAAALASIYLWRDRVRAEKEIEREADERRRRQRVRDLLLAIRAEIMIEAEPLAVQFAPQASAAARSTFVARLRDDRPNPDRQDMPQAPTNPTKFVFEIVKSDLSQLPVEVIDDVVRFYKYDERLTALVEAFGAGRYQGLSDQRQIEAVDALLDLGQKTLRSAVQARHRIDDYLSAEHNLPRRWTERDERLWSSLNEDDDGATHGTPPSLIKP